MALLPPLEYGPVDVETYQPVTRLNSSQSSSKTWLSKISLEETIDFLSLICVIDGPVNKIWLCIMGTNRYFCHGVGNKRNNIRLLHFPRIHQ